MKKIYFKNDLGMIKETDVGFSWAVFFFGVLIPLLNRDYRNAVIMSAVQVVLVITIIGIFAIPFVNLFYCFFYNEWHMSSLLKEGYHRIKE